jgi:ABC-2 type transport system permease protein/capsular polysaccharide transport system permease protein
LSGSAFLVSALPPFAQEIVLYIPMVHGVELVREGLFGSKAHAIYDLGYVIPFSLVLSAAALILARWVQDRMVPE